MRKSILSSIAAAFAAVVSLTASGLAAAEQKVVLQISDAGAEKQTLVLNVANNLLKTYKPGELKMEIVAFGPGLRLLFADNVNKNRVQSLAASDVRFSACQNTVKGMTKILGHPPVLSKEAIPVEAGVERILELTGQGYTLVRP